MGVATTCSPALDGLRLGPKAKRDKAGLTAAVRGDRFGWSLGDVAAGHGVFVKEADLFAKQNAFQAAE